MRVREAIGAMRNGVVYHFNVLTTKQIDKTTWGYMYKLGYREPRFPLPVTRHVADVSITWACISLCQCPCCLDHYMDGLEADFPDAFT